MIDVEREMGEAPLSRFHLRFAALIGTVLFIDGYDLFNAAYVAPYVKAQWQLGAPQVGLMLSLGLAGLAAGALLQGPLADRFGRRRIMLAGVWLLGLASLALATLAHDFSTFCVLRVALGIALGMLSPIAFVYINEWAPASCANRYATMAFVLPFSLGGIFAGLAGMTLAPTYGWHALYWIGAAAIPIALLCHAVLPESVRFLAARERWAEVRAILRRLRPDRVGAYGESATFIAGGAPHDGGSTLATVFDARHRTVTLTIWIASALSLFCLHGLTAWLPSILLREGAAVNTAFGYGSLLMTMQIVGGLVAGWFADRHGRLPVMAAGFVGGAAALLLLATTIGGSLAFVAVAAAGFFIFGTQAVMNNYTAVSYATAIRGTAVGMAVAVSRIGGVAGPLLIGWTQTMPHALWTTLAMLAAAQAIAALVVASHHARTRRRDAPHVVLPVAGSSV
ncbi:MFS transporter [Sphingomonas sp. LB3N6]|uniref:MFS transporter n=1 Tax=Sphingomonas fucosidasi TaxID=3096164 RepID=UPI002FC8EE00